IYWKKLPIEKFNDKKSRKVNMQLEFYLATATLFSCKELDFYLAKYILYRYILYRYIKIK
ncbi:MAG: hypothetical protein K9N00_03995, partial [Candidatus Marinimicrobia bacterium]|nr:hypothetical protein [Candidatus Neomarinimicrobiota bacterium]